MSTRKAQVGEAIPMDWRYSGQEPTGHTDFLVQPACDGVAGGHYCVTHPDADVRNNISFTSHVEGPGKHVEVWLCPVHGPEAPPHPSGA